MEEEKSVLTTAEWHVMECLWEKSPRSGRETVEYLAKTVGWSRSTTLTLLRRMRTKGVVACQEEEGVQIYSPLVRREDAVQQETANFLNRVYHGSVAMMLSALTSKMALTPEELSELQAILAQAEGANEDG